MTAPIVITGAVVGGEQTALDLRRKGSGAREVVRRHVQRAGITVQNTTKFQFLSGQALNKRTGRLINSINEKTEDLGDLIQSTVGSRLPYARFWELGFHGVENVRAYVRSVKSRNIRGRIEGKAKAGKTASGIGYVRAHERAVNQAARPFLKPALAASRPAIHEEFVAAAEEIAAL